MKERINEEWRIYLVQCKIKYIRHYPTEQYEANQPCKQHHLKFHREGKRRTQRQGTENVVEIWYIVS